MKRHQLMWLLTMLMVAATFLSACEEGIGSTGRDVLPNEDLINFEFTDTIRIEMESRRLDSVNTFSSSRQLFGNIKDPDFGDINAVTYFQFLAQSELNFGDTDNLIFDSLVLNLDLIGAYGDLSVPQTLRIHPLTQPITEDPEPTSIDETPFNANVDLGESFLVDFSENGRFDDLAIRLNDDLGQRLLFGDPDSLGDRDIFPIFFPGVRISTDPVLFTKREPGAIFSIDGESSISELVLHYQKRDSATGPFEPTEESFLIRSFTPRYTQISRENFEVETVLGQELDEPDTKDLYEFVQSGALIKGFVKFPDVDQLTNLAVSRAELVLKVDPVFLGGGEKYDPPASLNIVFADADGNELTIEGQPVVAANAATYDSQNNEYSFSLTNYIQELISGRRDNNGLIILPASAAVTMNRAVLGGTQHPTLSPVLNLTYSTLPQ
ncbi:MAG: DUF4270 family protein [Bacteroidota bacterium]